MNLTSGRPWRVAVLLAFAAGCTAVFLWFLSGTATRVPLLSPNGYLATVQIRDVDNLVPASKVRMAGVVIGEVRSVKVIPNATLVTFAVDMKGVAPLHQGVTIQVGNKSLVGDTYLNITDGTGPALPDGSVLPDDAVRLSTQLDDVIHSLDPAARSSLASMLRSTGAATAGTQQSVAGLATGLGGLGRGGNTALDAVARQSADLRQLGRNTEILMNALDEGQGEVADLVSNAQRITSATAGQHQAFDDTMRRLPGVLHSADDASSKIAELSHNLGPVASGLRRSSSNLNDALHKLRPTTSDIRGLLPYLSDVQRRAPRTFDRLSTLKDDIHTVSPSGTSILRDLDPALRYASPYGTDLGVFFANFNAVFYPDEAGVFYARLLAQVNEAAVVSPLKTSLGSVYYNPLPKPGAGAQPGPFVGHYPRVERDRH